jgi:microcystin-dependent protein
VRIWNGTNLTEVGGLFAYDPAFGGGVQVAVGDITGDGKAEIVTGAGGGPHVRVWNGADLTEVGGFFAYEPSLAGRRDGGPLGSGFILAETGGAEVITLTVQQIAAHSHPMLGTTSLTNDTSPANNVVAQSNTLDPYQSTAGGSPMAPQSINSVGGSQPHTNFQPYLCVDFIISLFGIFPSPT